MRTSADFDTRFTYDDFLLFPDDGKRHEIIDGEHYVTPSPHRRHQVLVGRLDLALGNFLAARPDLGEIYLAGSTWWFPTGTSSNQTCCSSPAISSTF